MGKKIFVSYKYLDSHVYPLKGITNTTARHYVDSLSTRLEYGDHIYKGEDDGEDLSSLEDSTIGSKLGDKIFDSTVTIVLISKGMKNPYTAEKDQWIPWEISYSLKEQSREGQRSKTNAMLAVVLPDENGSYDYYMTYNKDCKSRTINREHLFNILKENMHNHKKKDENVRECNGTKIYIGSPSYIESVKWNDFISNINYYIELALNIRKNINEYELIKNVH